MKESRHAYYIRTNEREYLRTYQQENIKAKATYLGKVVCRKCRQPGYLYRMQRFNRKTGKWHKPNLQVQHMNGSKYVGRCYVGTEESYYEYTPLVSS